MHELIELEPSHSSRCTVCAHPFRNEIEALWMAGWTLRDIAGRPWMEPEVTYSAIGRHLRAAGIDRNPVVDVVPYLMNLIQQWDPGKEPVKASNVTKALEIAGKISGQLINRTQTVPHRLEGIKDDPAALAYYAQHGRLPDEEEEIH